MDQSVIPECFVDTNLVETLVPPKQQYNHQHGCGAVTSLMKGKFEDRFAVAIIDRDKQQVDYLNEFNIISDKGSLILHKHRTRHHYIIQINPAMERFIMDNAAKQGVSLLDFELPDDLDRLKKEAKTANSKNDRRFKKLFRYLFDNGSEDFERLRKWISYLKDHPFDVNVEMLSHM